MTNLNEEIRQHILTTFLPGETADNLRDDTPLRTSGILDSVATLQLVNFLEERCGIEIEAHEVNVDNFDSISRIVSFVGSKGGKTS